LPCNGTRDYAFRMCPDAEHSQGIRCGGERTEVPAG
jgi:hypothetical protein